MPKHRRRGTRATRAAEKNEKQLQVDCFDIHDIEKEWQEQSGRNTTKDEEVVIYDREFQGHLLDFGDTNPNKGENPGKAWGRYFFPKNPKNPENMTMVLVDMLSVVNNDAQHFKARYYMDCQKECIMRMIIKNIKNGCDGIKIVIGGSIRCDGINNYDDITPKKLVDEFVEMLKEIVPEHIPWIILSYSEKQCIYRETCVDDIVCLLGNHRSCRRYRTRNAGRLLGDIIDNIESCVGTYFDEKGYTRNVLLATSDFNNNSNKNKKEKGLTSFLDLTEYYLGQKNCNVYQIAMETKEQNWRLQKLMEKGLITYRL